MSGLVLTREAHAEVRRNLFVAFGLILGGLLLFLIALAALINPPGSTEGGRFAALLMVAMGLPATAVVGTCLTLAYPMGCWPGFMRAKRIATLYGIDTREISNEAMRGRMKRKAFWVAFLRGALAASGFVVPWFLITWSMSKKGFPEGTFFPALLVIIYAGGVSARAWVIRELVAGGRRPDVAPG